MISKAMFCRAMNSILAEKARLSKLEDALETHFAEGYVIVKESETLSVLLDLLKEEFCDDIQYSTIEWWLFEKVEKKIYNEDKTVFKDVTTVEDLYDYLVDNLKEGN